MPGMPDMPNIPGMDAAGFSGPMRTLTMDLTSDKKVNAQSKAGVMIPEGLRLGPEVKLTVDLPEKSEVTTGGKAEGDMPDFTMKLYWKSSEKVLPGQPKVLTAADVKKAAFMPPEKMKQIQKSIEKEADRSHAYWPGRDFKKLDKNAATPGNYTLTTNYCGETSFSMEPSQNFLDPINLTSLNNGADLAKSIKVQWDPVPNAVAYLVTAFSSSDKVMITWTSSADPEMQGNIYQGAISKADMKKYLDSGVLLPASTTACYIPAGIFEGTRAPMLMVTAYGNDSIQEKDGIETQIVVRSTATATLSGMMSKGSDEESIKSDEENIKSGDSDSAKDSENTVKEDDSNKTPDKPADKDGDKVKKGLKKLRGVLGL